MSNVIDSILESLNNEQRLAVEYTDGPLLVLAGAGTGKTRVIISKILYLISSCGLLPENILAITFTNKAALEMKTRIDTYLRGNTSKVSIDTFHGLALKILFTNKNNPIVGGNFGIIDRQDAETLIKDLLADLQNINDENALALIGDKNLSEKSKTIPYKQYLKVIGDYKNTLSYVKEEEPDDLLPNFKEVFSAYNDSLKRRRLIDYDDMLSLALRLFMNNPDILDYYRDLFKYILVDEYQDTNILQYAFLKVLLGEKGNICVVGDDDQSIYSWRGAIVDNILYFDKHFNNVKEIKLTKNYRSAPEILSLANKLILNNINRRGKELSASSFRKGSVKLLSFKSDSEEANKVAEFVKEQINVGIPPDEIAVLYRTNAQSRQFETALNNISIPYKVIGGIGFYQRKEIKDVISYLKLYENRYDEQSFIRSAKNPPKFISTNIVNHVNSYAISHNVDYLTALQKVSSAVTPRQASALGNFYSIITNLSNFKKISQMIDYIISSTNYKVYIKEGWDEYEAETRIANLEELYNAARAMEDDNPNITLFDFISATSLLTDKGNDVKEAKVNLMTLHASKGLEFESVFLVGLEEGLFPVMRSSTSNLMGLEEERRLCYVGITRAKTLLTVTKADSRMRMGKSESMKPSLFYEEMSSNKQASHKFIGDSSEPYKGAFVTHDIFGKGRVMDITGKGSSAKVDVMFEEHGLKKLVARFIKLLR